MKGATLVIYMLIIIFMGCSTPSLLSTWQNDEIKIDGSRQDWGENINYLDDELVAVSAKNDNDFLYFCFATSNRTKINQIMQFGFTVWLDPINSDGKTIGIRYPINKLKEPGGERKRNGKQNESKNTFISKEKLGEFKRKQNEVLILNEDKFPLSALPIKNKRGIEVELGTEMKQLVYELRVPITNNNLNGFFVDALPGEEIKISFESGKIKRTKKNSGMRNNPEMGMSGSKRGGKRGGNNGQTRKTRETIDPIDFSIDIKLSNNN